MYRFWEDNRTLQEGTQRFGYHSVIQSPALVPGAGPGPVGPPGILMGFCIEVPETVYKSTFNKISDPFSFHGKEAGHILVPDRVVDVYGAVADIEISTDNQVGDLLFELVHILLEIVHILQLMIQSLDIGAGWNIQTHDRDPAKICPDVPPFRIHICNPGACFHMIRFLPTEDRNPAVSFLLSRKPIVMGIPGPIEKVQVKLVFGCFDLLKANHIGGGVLQPRKEPFSDGRPDPIDIIGSYFQINCF